MLALALQWFWVNVCAHSLNQESSSTPVRHTVSRKDSTAGWGCLVSSRNEGMPQTFVFLSKQINVCHCLASQVCTVPGIWDGCIALSPSLQCVANVYSEIIDNAKKKHLQRQPALPSLLVPFICL